MKALHLPGADILLVFSIFVFCLGFLPTALISSYRSQEERKSKWLYVTTFVVFFVVFIGALFKILHWPGASVLLFIGIPLPFVLFLPVYLYHSRNDKSTFNLLAVVFGLTILAVFSVLLALNVSSTVINNYTVSGLGNEKSAKFNQLASRNLPDKYEIKLKSDEICNFIDELKCKLLIITNNPICTNGKLNEDFRMTGITSIENSSTQVSLQFYGESISRIDILKGKLAEYQKLISGSEKVSKELKELTNTLFNANNVGSAKDVNESQTQNWAEREFPTNHLAIVLDVLSRIQSEVRFVESECLSAL